MRDKAEQAYLHFQQPVLVNDDTWSIPALRGFPSTGMKLCNDFLLAEDWLRLMNSITDRRIFLVSHYGFHDGKSVHVLTNTVERVILQEAKGKHVKSPCLEVIGRLNSDRSDAEEITAGKKKVEHLDFWQELADLVNNA